MEYLFAFNLIVHHPVRRFRCFAYDPNSLNSLIERRKKKIKLCAQRIDERIAYKRCFRQSSYGKGTDGHIDEQLCVHADKSANHHRTIIRNAEVEIDYLSKKIDRLGGVIERFTRIEFGH